MNCDRKQMLLYAVTDRSWLNGQTLSQQVEAALRGGATCIQLREKHRSHAEFLEEALELKALCGRYHVPLIINDNVRIALEAGADGVHVGQQDMQAAQARREIGPDRILGVSAQTVEQALMAEKNGADYLGVGAVFSTSTKEDARPVSYETLKAICGAVSIPVCAIGGINKKNMPELSGSGIDGVALVSAVFSSPDIEAECRVLRDLSEKLRKR